jgi:hypothetical protein
LNWHSLNRPKSNPHFTLEAGLRLIEFMPDLRYDAGRDAFVSKDSSDEQSEEEVFSSVMLVIENPVKTFPIGAGSWCWDLSE